MRIIMQTPILICLSLVAQSVGAEEPTPEDVPTSETTDSGGGDELTDMPVLMQFVEAEYPELAQSLGIEAATVLAIDISEDGTVEQVRVAQPAVPPGYGFDEAAMEAATHFEFEPARAGEEAVPVTITFKYNFVLAEPEASAESPPPDPPEPMLTLVTRLLERGTRSPLVGATVTVFRGEGKDAVGFEAVSNADGFAEFFDLDPGEWKVLCDPQGYYPVRTAETLGAGEVLEVTYHVERMSYSPFDVLVEGRRPKKEVTRRTVKTEEIEKIPGTFGDPLGVVKNLPSVARVPLGSGEIVVRGSSPEDTLINIDGVAIPYLYHFGGIRSAVPAGMLEYIDFYPGNYSAYFGRATGGLLDVKPKRLAPERLGGYLDVSLLDASVYLEAPIGDHAAIAVGGRRSYVDAILRNVIPDDSSVSLTSAPRYYDYQLLATVRPARGHEIRLFGFGSDDRFELLFENPADAPAASVTGIDTYSYFYRAILEHQWQISDSISNEIKLSAGTDAFYMTMGGDRGIEQDLITLQARETFSWQVNELLKLRAGLDALVFFSSWDITFVSPPKEGQVGDGDLDGDLHHSRATDQWHPFPGIFVEAEWTVGNLLVVPGLRGDYFGMSDDFTFDPRITLRYALSDQLTLKGGAGIYHQSPSGDEIDKGFGNPALDVFWSAQYSAGIEVRPWRHLSFDVTLFYKDLQQMVSPSDAFVERDGATVAEVYNNGGRGRVYGADILIRHEFANNFFGWVAYTISRAERLDSGATRWRPFDYDQTHILTALGTYRLPRNWEIGVRWRLVTGSPDTPYHAGVFHSDKDEYLPTVGKVNSTRLPTFHQLDVRVDKRWIYDDWMLSVYFDIQNIYNQPNAEAYEYNYDYTARDTVTGLTFLPILGIRGEF
jgi:TonB family protein